MDGRIWYVSPDLARSGADEIACRDEEEAVDFVNAHLGDYLANCMLADLVEGLTITIRAINDPEALRRLREFHANRTRRKSPE